MIEKFEDSQGTNEIPEIPDKLSKKSSAFFQSFIQNCNGYKGWRFICTADETHMRSAITLVISEEIFGLIYRGPEIFKCNFEFDSNIFTKFLVLIMVSLSQDMMAFSNLASEKFLKSPLLLMSIS